MKSGAIEAGQPVNICVPTGNFGNILAAWYAKQMGLPVARLICASNENNVLTDFINTGVYDKNREFKTTISPSMDILISSNLERLLFDLSDAKTTKEYMFLLAAAGRYEVSAEIKHVISENFFAGYCDDSNTKNTINKVWNESGYLMDTHTAVAYTVYENYKKATGDETKTIIASTANPFKFNKSVLGAISESAVVNASEFEMLEKLSDITGQKAPDSLATLSEKEIRFDGKCEKQDMQSVVDNFLK